MGISKRLHYACEYLITSRTAVRGEDPIPSGPIIARRKTAHGSFQACDKKRVGVRHLFLLPLSNYAQGRAVTRGLMGIKVKSEFLILLPFETA